MASRADWSGLGPYAAISLAAVVLTSWQVRGDRSVFEPYVGSLPPVGVVLGATLLGAAAMASLQATSGFAVDGPGTASEAIRTIAWTVPLFAAAAIAADLVLRYDEDTNVAMPDALRFYPAIAVVVETALHLVPLAVLVLVLGAPTGLDGSFWRLAVGVATFEAVLQAVYAPSVGTAAFSALHLVAFGVTQVWMFRRFGFVWMLGFRLTYYLLWHVAWGAARLRLLF